jgi:hypothetical protein
MDEERASEAVPLAALEATLATIMSALIDALG